MSVKTTTMAWTRANPHRAEIIAHQKRPDWAAKKAPAKPKATGKTIIHIGLRPPELVQSGINRTEATAQAIRVQVATGLFAWTGSFSGVSAVVMA